MLPHTLPAPIISAHSTGGSQPFVKPHIFRHAQTQTAAHSLCQMALAWSCIKQKPRNLRQVSEQGRTLSSLHPPPHLLYTHTPHPLTPTTICQKLSYKFLFVSIFKHDGEELSLYMSGRLCVYPAAPAPGNKRKPPLLLVEAGKGRRLRGWQEEKWMETGREREGERNSLSDSNLGTWTFYDFPALGKTDRLLGIALGTKSNTSLTIKSCVGLHVRPSVWNLHMFAWAVHK